MTTALKPKDCQASLLSPFTGKVNRHAPTDGLKIVKHTRSSAAAEIARDADNVDYKFSEATVHLTKNTIQIRPILRQMGYRRMPSSSNHARTQRRPCVLRLRI